MIHRRLKNGEENIIDYPHIVVHYMHLKHTMFRKEILQKGMKVKEFWCRYEWQNQGSPHVHGFLWLEGAPNMDTLDWENEEERKSAERYFDSIIHAWNPRHDVHQRNINVFFELYDPISHYVMILKTLFKHKFY